jgi:cytochrome oxidase Cu insertion factor (SCO1/SenC/PrrC family)
MPGSGSSPGAGNSVVISAFHAALIRQGAVILVLLVLVFVGWNVLRSAQYRRAVADGRPSPGPGPRAEPEPVARRVLRLGFGALWIIDGLLQLQPQMPVNLPSEVLQPAAATSPGWVQGLVNVAVDGWSRHPAQAAAAVVWIEVGIGLLLMVAPRGRWSRGAGLVSLAWGLLVWIFGEAFGGLFAPGLALLAGAPGAALLYAAGGGLLALPERAWRGRQLGRVVTASVGALLVALAVLQAWPGRGSWQGSLGTMARSAATTLQPHVLSSLLTSFASFDRSHAAVVNLVAVVVPFAVGLVFLVGGRLVVPAFAGLTVFAVVGWVLIEDLGVFGGTGTDPNSLPPLLLLAGSGVLAVVRAPAVLPVTRPSGAGASDGEVVDAVPVDGATVGDDGPDAARPGEDAEPGARGPWWERLEPRRGRRVALTLGAAVFVVVGAVPLAAAWANTTSDVQAAEAVDGAPVVTSGPAPDFHLVDQSGRPVSLADLRGYTVALTFLDPVCTTDCPVIAQEMRVASQMLGASASKARFVAVVTNPLYNSVAVVDAFDRQEGLDTQSNWLYLTGSAAELGPVWSSYGVEAYLSPAGAMAAHSEVAYVIDASGSIRRIINPDPGDGSVDASSFSNLLATQMAQVMGR